MSDLTARLEDETAARRIAADAADRFRDVLSECLGHPDENPGDDVLVAELRAHFGKTGPEPTRWRDFCTGALAHVDQMQATVGRGRHPMSDDDLTRWQAAIATVEDSRRTHVEWLAHWGQMEAEGHAQCAQCKAQARTAGDAEHHRRCIAEYDNVLTVLAAHPVASPAGQNEEAGKGWAVNAQLHDPLILGTPVLAWPGSREGSPLVTRTRSEVWTVAGIRVVSVDGHAGGIALSHIDVLPTRPAPAVDEEA